MSNKTKLEEQIINLVNDFNHKLYDKVVNS